MIARAEDRRQPDLFVEGEGIRGRLRDKAPPVFADAARSSGRSSPSFAEAAVTEKEFLDKTRFR